MRAPELEMELQEHTLVLQTIEPLDTGRTHAPRTPEPDEQLFSSLEVFVIANYNILLISCATRQTRCFRLVGGVLVQRTVGEVAPAVRRNKDSLAEVRGSQSAGKPVSVGPGSHWERPGRRASLMRRARGAGYRQP